MKKTITALLFCATLATGAGLYAQAPPPGPGGPPAGRPEPRGPRDPEAGLQQLSTFQGKVTRLSANDDYIYDGFYLQTAQDSLLVKFPGHLGSQVTALIKTGSDVTVIGTLENNPEGVKESRMVSITSNGKTIYDMPPASPPAPPSDNFVNGNGKIAGTQLDREGNMNGLLLDNGTVLRIPPGAAAQLVNLAKSGSPVGYSGMLKTPQAGEVAAGNRKIVHCNTISINGQQFLVR